MNVTDPTQRPETIVCDWRTQMRGAPVIERPLDVMWDIDDVVFPTMYSIHDLAREAGLHDGTVEPRWTGWEVYSLPDGTPCPPEVYWDLWSDFAARGGYLNTPPIPEAAEAIRELYFAGHRIHFVTARGFMKHATDIRRWTADWIGEFALPWHTLTFAKDKVAAMAQVLPPRLDPMGDGVHVWAKPAGRFDYAIDDSPKNVAALRGADVEAYLLDHAHNLDHPGDLPRVSAPSEFAKMILEAQK